MDFTEIAEGQYPFGKSAFPMTSWPSFWSFRKQHWLTGDVSESDLLSSAWGGVSGTHAILLTLGLEHEYRRQLTMPLRNRGGKWHYRFRVDGKTYDGTTGLAATKQNKTKASMMEMEYRQALLEGRRPARRLTIREFTDAADDFLKWAKAEHHSHPQTYKRLATSFTSLTEFFGRRTVGLIDPALVDRYKTWRQTSTRFVT